MKYKKQYWFSVETLNILLLAATYSLGFEVDITQFSRSYHHALKKRYPNFVVNGINQLSLMKGNWGGIGTTPVQCPSWAILSLDHMGRVKQPCCIGSADRNSLKPICQQCGLGCYSGLVAQGIKGGN